VAAADAHAYVLGYSVFNDVTARDLQRQDVQFTRGKGFDTFGPLGPWIDTDFRPADQRLTVTVNGELRQDGRLSDMIFDVPTLIEAISRVMTLEPFDVIATGTPEGVGPLAIGDAVSVSIEGLGTLDNTVVAPGE
jgi:2-keto-4-pentenoate hydratase/2-oxohepta-3-ene-1,7-dioic acid hydratase in catechol pathway